MPEILSGEPGLSTSGGGLEAVLADYLRAAEAGRAPDRMELLAGHPDLAPELAAFFAGQDRFGRLAAPLRDAVSAVQESTIEDKLAEGGRLGDFHLLREIGRGGMGVVYEAEQLSLGRKVALKVLPFAAALDAKQLQRFKNEAHAAANLQHQNIVPVYAVGCERGVHFYAMQFVEGQTLAALIRELRQLKEGDNRGSRMEDRGSQEGAWDSQRTGPYAPEDRVARTESSKGVISNLAPPATPFEDSGRASQECATVQNHGALTETAPVTPRSSILDSPSSFFRTVAQLGIQAAEALEHAHQLGVIHRDIKPANLMIEPSPTDHSPLTTHHSPLRLWITDFGLAHCQGGSDLTTSGDLLGTLRYMSPEQALAQRALVDHRTDIYSLGATLYELLTLEPAFPGTDRQELLRQIAFEEPKPPRRVNKAIPAELETIVLKAIQKNPEDRYATAQEVADDFRRFLDNKPIRAKRPTILARARKWTKRHWGVVTATLVTAVIVLAISTGFIWRQWYVSEGHRKQAVNAQEQAQKSAAKAEAINDFLVNQLLGAAAEEQARGRNLTVDDVIHKAAEKIDGAFPDQPEVEAAVRMMIGEAYLSLGLPAKAESQYRRALDLRQRILGDENPDTLKALQGLATSHARQGHLAEAETLFRKALDGMRRVLGDEDPAMLDLLHDFAWTLTYQGRWSQAADILRQSLQARRRVLGPDNEVTLDTMTDLAETLSLEGNWDEAEKLATDGLRIGQQVSGEPDARALKLRGKLAFVLLWEGKGREAEAVSRKEHHFAVSTWGPDNPETLIVVTHLAMALVFQDVPDKLDEAEQISRRNLQAWLSAPDVNQARIDECRLTLGCALRGQGRWLDAERELEQALKSMRRIIGEEHPYIFWLECYLGAVLEASGKKAESGTHLRRALNGNRKVLPPEHPFLSMSLYEWAEHLLEEGDVQQAEEALREVSRIPRQNFPPGNLRPLGEALAALGWVLTKQGRAKEGEPLLRDGLEICLKYLAEGHWATAEAESRLGGCLAALGQFADAEKFLVTGYLSLETARGAPPPRTRQALERVIELYETWGQGDKAAEWRAKRQAQPKVEKEAEGKK